MHLERHNLIDTRMPFILLNCGRDTITNCTQHTMEITKEMAGCLFLIIS